MVWTKRIDFTLWPVGQGLFTHADIWVGGKSFRVVYDCGTYSSRQVVGPSFFAPLANKDVDLLVISHFHWDHISRIPELLDAVGTKKVKEVWIPYLSPEQRLLFAVSTAMEGTETDESASRVNEITRMAGMGREWFEERGCVVREFGAPDDPFAGEGPPGEEGPRNEEGIPEREDEGRDSDPPAELSLTVPHRLDGAFSRGSAFRAYQSRLDARPASGRIESPVRLLTWIRPIDSSRTEKLANELQNLLSVKDVDPRTLSAIAQAVRDQATRGDLRNLYESLSPDLNSGSLFLLAQPTIRPRQPVRFCASVRGLPHWWDNDYYPYPPAVLWTGDATAEVLDELLADTSAPSPLREQMRSILVHQVPHHGAAACLSQQWIDTVVERRAPHSSVISAGRSSRYLHPSPEAVWRYHAAVVCEGSPPFETSLTWR